MTRPVPWRRSTAAERRRWRAEFRALKERVATDPSPETIKRRETWKAWANRERAQGKIARALAGVGIRPFSPAEAAKIKPGEHDLLRAEVANRLAQLSAEERKALTAGQHLLLACFTVEQLRAVASV